jgi:hypothetical protein
MRARIFLPFPARELLLAIAVVAVFVGAFVNCQIVRKALSATKQVSASLSGADK